MSHRKQTSNHAPRRSGADFFKTLIAPVMASVLVVSGCAWNSGAGLFGSVDGADPDTLTFAVPGAAAVSGRAPADFSYSDLMAYVPESDMTQFFALYVQEETGEPSERSMTRFIWSPSPEPGSLFAYIDSYGPVGSGFDLPFDVAWDPEFSCLRRDGRPCLALPGRQVTSGCWTAQTSPYFFTVTLPGGVAADCLCCLEIEDLAAAGVSAEEYPSGPTITRAHFFAPGLGCVLETNDRGSYGEFSVSQALLDAKAGAEGYVFSPPG